MTDILWEVEGEKKTQIETIQPDIQRKEYIFEEGQYTKSAQFTITVPEGKKYKTVVKIITTDITK